LYRIQVAEPYPDTQVPDVAEGHAERPVGSSQTQPAAQKTETTEIIDTKTCSEHYRYISTMTSFDDPYFRLTISKDLMKDRHATSKAFKSLSPELV
jgi:hypothetical protein